MVIGNNVRTDNVPFNGKNSLKTNGCHSFLKFTYRCLENTYNICFMSNDKSKQCRS